MAILDDDEDKLIADVLPRLVRDDASRPAITVDYERYAHFLEDADLTEDQKREFLQALWSIIVNFVDLGFGVHPLQQACGKLDDNGPKTPTSGQDAVQSKEHSITRKFDESADAKRQPEEERIIP